MKVNLFIALVVCASLVAGGTYKSVPFIPITDSEYFGLVSLSDENYVSLSRKGDEAELIQNIVDKIGYDRDIPVCVVSKENRPKVPINYYADKKSEQKVTPSQRGLFRKKPQEAVYGKKVWVIFDPKKFTPGDPIPRSARAVDPSFFESHNPKYKIEHDFFEGFPPKSPVEYVTTRKEKTVVRCVLIRKTHDPYPSNVKPALTFVSENIEEPEERLSQGYERPHATVEPTKKPLRTYVLLRPEGYDALEEFNNFE